MARCDYEEDSVGPRRDCQFQNALPHGILVAQCLVSTLPEENDCISIQLEYRVSCYHLPSHDWKQPVAVDIASGHKHNLALRYSIENLSQYSSSLTSRSVAYNLDILLHMLLILSYKLFLFMLILYKLFLCRYIQVMQRLIPSPHSTSSSPNSAAPRRQWHHPSL